MANNGEVAPFSDPERMRRGIQAVQRTRTMLIEGADGRTRSVTARIDTGLVLRSFVVAEPVELGWQIESPADAQAAVDIPINGTSEYWNAHDDPSPETL